MYNSHSEVNQKGFSIIEMLITMVIFGILSTGIATFMQHQSNISKYLDDKASHRDFKIELERLLGNPDICLQSFQTVTPPSAINSDQFINKINITDLSGSQSFSKNSSYDGLKINNLKFKNLDISSTANEGFVELNVQVLRNVNDQRMKDIKLRIRVELDPATRKIDACSLVSSGSGEIDKACVVSVLRSTQSIFSGYTGQLSTRSYASTFSSAFEIIKDGDEVLTYETQAHGPSDCNNKMAWSVYSKKLKCKNKIVTEHSRRQLSNFYSTIVREVGDDSGCGRL